MREFLVTKFVCAVCGSNLELSYEVPKPAGRYADGEPTGADMVQNCIAITPCRRCKEPVDAIMSAVTTLVRAALAQNGKE